ncbi:MAG: hypothetical protein AAGB04_24360 [Pseudomonadota bacterium]
MSPSAVANETRTAREQLGQDWLYAFLGFALVVMFPTVFWLGIVELGAFALGLDYSAAARVVLGTFLAVFLTLVWSLINNVDLGAEPRAAT